MQKVHSLTGDVGYIFESPTLKVLIFAFSHRFLKIIAELKTRKSEIFQKSHAKLEQSSQFVTIVSGNSGGFFCSRL